MTLVYYTVRQNIVVQRCESGVLHWCRNVNLVNLVYSAGVTEQSLVQRCDSGVLRWCRDVNVVNLVYSAGAPAEASEAGEWCSAASLAAVRTSPIIIITIIIHITIIIIIIINHYDHDDPHKI